MKNHKLISKFNITNRVIYIIGLLVFIGLAIGCFSNYDIKDVRTFFYLVGTIFFLVFAFLFIRELYNAPSIIINSEKVELKKFFNIKIDIIELNNIHSWVKRKKNSKYGDYEVLYLVLSDFSKVKIKSYNYSNFYELEQYLTRKKSINSELQKALSLKENKQYAFAFLFIGSIFLLITVKNFEYKNLLHSDVSTVKGHLSEPLRIERGRNSKTLIIKLNEFPELNFRIAGMSLSETYYQDLMNDFKAGQAIEFAIKKEVYSKKISKTIELTFWDLIFHYDKVHIVEIINNDFKYLSLEDYNRAHGANNKWIVGFFGLIGSLLIIGGIVIYKKRHK